MTSSKGRSLPAGWKLVDGRLRAGFRFADFRAAMAFLTEVALAAEAAQHHPDFAVHWNEVRFTLWSHDVDGITSRDHKLAVEIAKIAARHAAKRLL